MAPRVRPEAVLRKRLRALARTLPGAADANPEAVHKARVASRRVREALPIVLSDAPARRRRRLRRLVERVTRALGPVRELDVSLSVVAELEQELGGDPALALLRDDITAERAARGERLHARLGDIDGRRLQARAERLAGHVASRVPLWELSSAAVLLVRLTRRVDELDAAVEAAGPLYTADSLHAVRIAVKKLRYAFELARDLGLLGATRALQQLRTMQQTLGRLNDLQVLVARAERLRAERHRLQSAVLKALVGTLEVRCRELHARYLAGRARLLAAVDEALADTAARTAEMTDTAADRTAMR